MSASSEEIIIVVPLLYSSVATKFKARKQKFSMHALSFPTRRSRVYLHSSKGCRNWKGIFLKIDEEGGTDLFGRGAHTIMIELHLGKFV